MSRIIRNPPAEDMGIGSAAKHRDCRRKKHRQRGDFHTAGRRTRGTAHQHEQDHDHLPGLRKLCQIHRVISRRTGCNRLE